MVLNSAVKPACIAHDAVDCCAPVLIAGERVEAAHPRPKAANPYRLSADDYFKIVDQLAHDIRTPLCVISEYASLIRDGVIGETSDECKEVMDITSARVGEIQLQMEALLTIAKLASDRVVVQLERCSLQDVMHEAIARVATVSRGSAIVLEADADPSMPQIECDPRLVRCVLVNMLWSVLKLVPPETTVFIEAAHDCDAGAITIRVASTGMRRYEVAPAGLIAQVQMVGDKQKTRKQRIDVALGLACDLSRVLKGKIALNDDSIEAPALEFMLPMGKV